MSKNALVLLLALITCQLTYGQSWDWARTSMPADYSFLGSSDAGGHIGTDGAGNVYTTGTFEYNIRFGTDTLRKPMSSYDEYYITKYDSGGILQWAKSFGSGDLAGTYDARADISVDASGNSIVAGKFVTFGAGPYTYTNNSTFDTFTASHHGAGPFFVVKYNTNGNVQWLKVLGGATEGTINSVTTSPQGDIYITGQVDINATFGPYILTSMGANNTMYLAKLDANGNVIWAKTTTGGIQYERSWGYDVIYGADGYIYTSGSFRGNVTFDTITLHASQYMNAYVAKYTTSGHIVWARMMTENNSLNPAYGLAVDHIGNSYFLGGYTDTLNMLGQNRLTATIPQEDLFLVKLDSNGLFQWASDDDGANKIGGAVGVDHQDNVYLTGGFRGTKHFGSYTLTSNNFHNAVYVEKIDPATAAAEWVVPAYGSCGVGGVDISLDPWNSPFITGSWSSSTRFASDTFTNPAYPTCNGSSYTAKILNVSLSIQAQGAAGRCTGDSVTVSATPAGYSYYAWSNGDTGRVIQVRQTDTLTAWSLNGPDTLRSQPLIIQFNPRPSASFTVDSTICMGDSSHFVNTSTISSGTMTYYWQFGDGSTSTLLNPVHLYNSASTYTATLIASANAGCSDTSRHHMTIRPKPSVTLAAGPYTRCAGDSVVLAAHVGFSHYLWTHGDTSTTIVLHHTDTVSVQVTDTNGCTSVASNHVIATFNANPVAQVVAISGSTTFCAGDTVTLSVPSGFTAYQWSSGQYTASIHVTTSGSFSVRVQNAFGCWSTYSDTVTLTISNPAKPAISLSGSYVFCQGDSVTLSAPVGYSSYLWSNGSTASTFTVHSAGSFYVAVTNSQGCHSPHSDTISTQTLSVPLPVITTSGPLNFCAGDSVILVGPVGYAGHLWSDGSTGDSLVVRSSGSFTLQVSDSLGCHSLLSAAVSASVHPYPARPVISASGPLSFCAGQDVVLTAPAGCGTYHWMDGELTQQVTVTASGIYAVYVSDSFGCYSPMSDTLVVSVHALPTPPSINSADTIRLCNGDSAIISSDISSGIVWSTGATTDSITVLSAGVCYVVYTDSSGCTAQSAVKTVITDTMAVPVISSNKREICFNGSASLCTSGTFTAYHWSTLAISPCIVVTSAGSYSLTVSDPAGCSASSSFSIQQTDSFTVTAVVDSVHCYGGNDGSISLALSGADGGYTYVWSDGATSQNINALIAGTYTAVVTDSAQCSTSMTYQVQQPSALAVHVSADSISCYGQHDAIITASATGGISGYSYLWSTGNTLPSIDSVSAGVYSLTVTDEWSCTAIAGVQVYQPDSILLSDIISDVRCHDPNSGGVNINVSGGVPAYTYLWSNNATSQNLINITAGIYILTVTDAHSCSATLSATVVTGADLIVQASLIDPACPQTNDGSITITATGASPFSYLWSDSTTGVSDRHLAAGVVSVKITDNYGCEVDSSFTLSYADSLSLRVSPVFDSIDLGESVTITTSANTAIKSYLWTPSLYLSCSDCADPTATPAEDMVYKLHVTDDSGCSADDSVTLVVHNDQQLYIPNAFSPNADGTNDFFEIFGSKNAFRYVDIQIYDRWGEKVYQSNDIDFKWDGTYKGVVMAPDIYVYTLDISFVGQTNATVKKGSITLIR